MKSVFKFFSCNYPFVVAGWTIVLAAFSVFFYKHIFHANDSDRAEYYRLMQEANPTISDKTKKIPYKASQKRKQVQKDIYYTQGADRLHCKLISPEAVLVLDQQLSGTELVEHMKDVQFYMQEEIFYVLPDGREALRQADGNLLCRRADPQNPASWISPETIGIKPMQAIRYCEGTDASYYYKTDRFFAERVRVSRYVAPGHDLTIQLQNLKPVMTGTADSIEFSLSGKEFNFTANRFRAKFRGGL